MNNTFVLLNKNAGSFLLKSVALSVFVLLLNFFNYFFHFVLPYSVEWNFLFTFIFAGLVNFIPVTIPNSVKTVAILAYFTGIYIVLLSVDTNGFEAFKLLHICLGLFLVGKDKSWYQNIGVLIAVILLNLLFIPNQSFV
jgi:hypothetical protein